MVGLADSAIDTFSRSIDCGPQGFVDSPYRDKPMFTCALDIVKRKSVFAHFSRTKCCHCDITPGPKAGQSVRFTQTANPDQR
ncbi:hypothetical protein RB10399 [Rhodopirellula baltica SH 1]|uniref:Uncharacterized protein n=1 Tax=Rhodopirellula baltica (strain DSM 10527 / NCIMB 13988 / SH1) TaxID=243090 RepID=Q7UF19_RHOBA|nr:hypothetical protein RB10399 [Rhodopirellula baltica SH 1]